MKGDTRSLDYISYGSVLVVLPLLKHPPPKSALLSFAGHRLCVFRRPMDRRLLHANH